MQVKYLTCKQIANITGKSLRTVWGWCNSGKLPASRPGGRDYVIKEADFWAFMGADNAPRRLKGEQQNEDE